MNRIALLLAALVVPAAAALASVDVNTASREELEAEGIGSAAAQAIVDYRSRNGPFRSPEEVRRVIDEAIAGKLHMGISISGPGTTKSAAPNEAPKPVEKSANVKPAPKPEAKAPAAPGNDKPQGKPASGDDKKPNVREQKENDADDRKT
jgi:competence protein ComEA